MTELHELTASQAAGAIRKREVSPVELVEALLRRIDALDGELLAWETVDREGALAAARRREREAGSEGKGPLHCVPVGVKDIFDTTGMRTSYGSPIFRDRLPQGDSAAVARLREAGAIILGKTVTTEFAFVDPARTRNPWNLSRTPGGSSSGSAAAVAARMVPAALGSQTGGSVLRPASYCGVVGLKPTYGRISRYGVLPAAWSLDHVGVIVRTVEDAALLLEALAGHDPRDHASSREPVASYREAVRRSEAAPILGLIPESLERAEPDVAAHLREVAARFQRAGAEVREVAFPVPMPELFAVRNVINQVEAAAVHSRTLKRHAEQYSPRIRTLVEIGALVPGAAYIQAQRLRRQLRPRMGMMLHGVDCLLMPTVSNVAPDPSTTGDPSFQGIWSLFGFPAISLPSGLSAERLPMGIQLVALPFDEERLLGAAAWCEGVLGMLGAPEVGVGGQEMETRS